MPKSKDWKMVSFGDDGKILIPRSPINCSALGYFDDMEDECWELIKAYLLKFGIKPVKVDGEECPHWELAKRIQDVIIEELAFSGTKFNFGGENGNS